MVSKLLTGGNNRVIFINLEPADGLDVLKTPFSCLKQSYKPKKNFTIVSRQHVTIAKNLSKHVFDVSVKKYLNAHYQRSFEVTKLKMLRKEKNTGRFERYEDVVDLDLGG